MRRRGFMGYMSRGNGVVISIADKDHGEVFNTTEVASPKQTTIHGAATLVAERKRYIYITKVPAPKEKFV